ncbi:hypothetical protein Ae201684P_015641 [Aphanomyces euteiches]|nr:hypothetical protein Ae201684P_015641 [Aphanomyces euteiches]
MFSQESARDQDSKRASMKITTTLLMLLVGLIVLVHALDVAELVITSSTGTYNRILSANESIIQFGGTLDSLSLGKSLVLVVYSGAQLNGQLEFYGQNFTRDSIYGIGSVKVVTLKDAFAMARQDPTDVVVRYYKLFFPNVLFSRVPVTQGVKNLTSMMPWIIQSMDIPEHVVVEAHRHENYEGESIIWTKSLASDFIKSFQVRLQNDSYVSKPLDSVTLYLSGYADSATLSMMPGEAVPTIIFLLGKFNIGFAGAEVPPGLVLLTYAQPNFEGSYALFRPGFYPYHENLNDMNMNSFKVLHESDALPNQPQADVSQVVQCQPVAGLVDLHIQHFKFQLVCQSSCMIAQWKLRMRSMRVVRNQNLPPQPPQALPSNNSFIESYIVGFPSMIGIALTFCSEFNFQGTCISYEKNVQYNDMVWSSYKSYTVTRSGDINLQRGSVKFIGCYPPVVPFLSWTPIFLQADEVIYELVYPWDQNVVNFTVPKGLVIAAFSKPNLQGDCFAWTADADDLGEWSTKIRSLMTTTLSNWSGCQPFLHETTHVPTTSPQKTPSGYDLPSMKPVLPSPSQLSTANEPMNSDDNAIAQLMVVTTMPSHTVAVPTGDSILSNSSNSVLSKSNSSNSVLSNSNSSNSVLPKSNSSNTTATPFIVIAPKTGSYLNRPTTTLAPTTLPLVCSCGVAVVVFVTTAYFVRKKKLPESSSDFLDYANLDWQDLDLWRLDIPLLPLNHQLATGSTSVIYLGQLYGRPVAVKILAKPTPDAVQAFIDEIMYVTQLKSPYIVSLIGVAWTNATNLQCVMEYMNLGDLRSYLANVKSFAWESKVACALSVAEALFFFHVQQHIHRDVKSRNILLDSVKGAKLSDFGASKEVIYGDIMTAAVGTLRWMAPEMLLFKPYTTSVDIYSFGVVMSELSTHDLPYANVLDAKGQPLSEESIAGRVIHDEMRPSFGECPVWFKQLGMRCMAQNPDDRPTAVQIIFELKRQ